MSQTPTPATDDNRSDVRRPGHTTPTWEVELLISGVAVFAMLQLPGWLGSKFLALIPRFDSNWATAITTVYVYLTCAAILLAVTFSLHLLMRAQWIALVGLHSVYPDGVRWEKLRMGPRQRTAEQRHSTSTAVAIERADNRATIVFSMGVMLASILLLLSLVAAAVYTVTLAIAAALGITINPGYIVVALTGLIVIPMIVLHWLDRRLGDRLASDSMIHRFVVRMMEFYARIHLGRGSHARALLASHTGARRVAVLIGLIILVTSLAVILGLDASRNPQLIGNYGLFPAPDATAAGGLLPAHYDDRRDPIHDPVTPYVQSAVISGPYLQLVVPYAPGRDTPAMQKQCKAALELSGAEARAAATLDCLARLHAGTLDGQPLSSLHYDIGSDPRTDRPALVAMIDVRALAPGRHVLQVASPPRADRPDNDKNTDKTAVIPFWR